MCLALSVVSEGPLCFVVSAVSEGLLCQYLLNMKNPCIWLSLCLTTTCVLLRVAYLYLKAVYGWLYLSGLAGARPSRPHLAYTRQLSFDVFP